MQNGAKPQDDTISPLIAPEIAPARVRPLLQQARDAGLAPEEILTALGLPRHLAQSHELGLSNAADTPGSAPTPDAQDLKISLADYYRLNNRLSLMMGDETCQISSRQLLPGSTDFVLANLEGCASLQDIMKVIARSYNLLHGGQYNAVERMPDSIDYVIDDAAFPYADMVKDNDDYVFFSIECVLIFLHCTLMTVAPQLAASAVKSLAIKRPQGLGDVQHLSVWKAPIRFGAPRYRIQLDRNAALAPLPSLTNRELTSHAVYLKIIETVSARQARSAQLETAVSRVQDALARGLVDQDKVADHLGVSVATLRRRLAAEGQSFRQLRRQTLNETAKRLLAQDARIPDIAETLGFAEFRSFNRAFKEWNGLTPKAFQTQLAKTGDRDAALAK